MRIAWLARRNKRYHWFKLRGAWRRCGCDDVQARERIWWKRWRLASWHHGGLCPAAKEGR